MRARPLTCFARAFELRAAPGQAMLAFVRWALAAVALLCCGCGTLGSELFVHGAPPVRADAIVVLGNRPARTAGGDVAPETARRVRRGATLFAEGLAPLVVFTGGPGAHGETEASVMSEYARSLGVPIEAIRLEPRARDTAENAHFAIELLCEGRARCRPRVIVVSSPYHLRRARRLFECAGADVQVAAAELPDDLGYRLAFSAYEYAVRFAYIFDDACARARR